MPNLQLRNVNFGRNRCNLTGSTGVNYKTLDVVGSVVQDVTTTGVYQTAPGIYAANISFPDDFNGQVVWTCPATGSLSASYATEQYNVEENDPKVAETWEMVNYLTGSMSDLYDISYGRWRIDNTTNQMVFFKEDNTTEVARFNLFDANGNPTVDGVFDRQRV